VFVKTLLFDLTLPTDDIIEVVVTLDRLIMPSAMKRFKFSSSGWKFILISA
jgi:hypothetical protein